MTDHELVKAAAKAAGLEVIHMALSGFNIATGPNAGSLWNPLTDDGDALRLTVKLGLSIERDFDRIDVYLERDLVVTEFFYERPAPTDVYAATRRAIVRAAAAIS